MKRVVLLVAAAFLVVGLAAPAHGDPVTFAISAITVSDTNPYTFSYLPVNPLPAFTLDTVTGGNPQSWSGSLFRVSRSEGFGDDGDESGTITVNFSFSAPPGFPGAFEDGILEADYRWIGTDEVDISWGGSRVVNFGTGGQLQVNMEDADFDWNDPTWIRGEFRLLQEPEVTGGGTVPEPGSMLLLGCGLIGLAGAVRRRMR